MRIRRLFFYLKIVQTKNKKETSHEKNINNVVFSYNNTLSVFGVESIEEEQEMSKLYWYSTIKYR